MENVRETTNGNERRDEGRRGGRKGQRWGADGGWEGEKERDDIPQPGKKNSETDVADEGLQRDRGNWSQIQYDN